ncbi:MAG: CDP-diacylglycerol--glycerol-3-phosphate 3-phosphatidyltransferase [Phycisphaerae bacterium]|nr:CDP-diacylglycerol--glycerol-3-phosphate 3-phosphatidyltransferase [Phycisphaerae bacterium]
MVAPNRALPVGWRSSRKSPTAQIADAANKSGGIMLVNLGDEAPSGPRARDHRGRAKIDASRRPRNLCGRSAVRSRGMDRRQLPNLITMSRLVLATVYFWMMLDVVHGWSGMDPAERARRVIAAGWVFGVAAGTDFLDGYFARRFNAVSAFGRIMDPFVDKVLVLGALVVVVDPLCPGSGVAPWMVIAIISRELFVTSLRASMEARGMPCPADRWGKWKMTAQSLAIPFAGVAAAGAFPNLGVSNEMFVPLTHWFILFTVALTIVSALPYILRSREAWR